MTDRTKANREKVAGYQRRYYEAHREKVAAKNRRYREANREKVAGYQRRYYEAHRGPQQATYRLTHLCHQCGNGIDPQPGRPPRLCVKCRRKA